MPGPSKPCSCRAARPSQRPKDTGVVPREPAVFCWANGKCLGKVPIPIPLRTFGYYPATGQSGGTRHQYVTIGGTGQDGAEPDQTNVLEGLLAGVSHRIVGYVTVGGWLHRKKWKAPDFFVLGYSEEERCLGITRYRANNVVSAFGSSLGLSADIRIGEKLWPVWGSNP